MKGGATWAREGLVGPCPFYIISFIFFMCHRHLVSILSQIHLKIGQEEEKN
jgi:hypothetical protein